MSDTLASLLIEIGVDAASLKSGFRRAISDAKSAGNDAGSAFGIGFRSPLLNAVAGVGELLQGVREGLRFAGVVSGSQVAAEFGQYRRQLQYIAGDARTAERAFRSLKNTAQTSNFNTDEVAQFGVSLAGRTGDVTGAAKQVQQTVDAAQASGVQNKDFGAFQYNLRQIQNQGDSKIRQPDYQQLLNYAPLLSTAMAKAYGISVAQASEKIQNATGNELSKMVLELGRKSAGAAAGASGADPYVVAANTVDSFNAAMEPTGRIVNAALLPLAQGVLWLTNQFGALNDATGGGAGLTAIIGLGTVAVTRFGGGLMEAWVAAKEAAAGLREVALSSAIAAKTQKLNSIGGSIGGAAGAAGLGKAGAAGLTAEIVGGLATAGVSLALDYAGTKFHESKDVRKQGIGDVLTAAGVGVAIGGAIGTVVPVIGNIVGAIVGGAVGLIVGSFQAAMRGDESKKDGAAERTAKATEDAAKTLKDMKTRQVGGGERFTSALRGLEYEHAIIRSAQTGFA